MEDISALCVHLKNVNFNVNNETSCLVYITNNHHNHNNGKAKKNE